MHQDARTIDSIFSSAANESGGRTHLQFLDGTTATYAQTFERAARLAGALRSRGIQRGDRVVCLMGNCRALYEFFIATSLLGAIAVPINTQSTGYEIDRLVRDCSASGCVAEGELAALLSEEAKQRLSVRLSVSSATQGWDDYEEAILGAPVVTDPQSRPADPCLIIYSSGTTGDPKGIVLRQECLVENAVRVVERLKHSSDDIFLTLLPSFHLFGYSFDFMYSGLSRAPMVVMEAFDAQRALDTIEKYNVTVLTGVPTMFARMFDPQLLASHKVDRIRLLVVGGGPVSPAIKLRLRGLGIEAVESYGQTEISTVAAVQIPEVDAPEGSCGPVLRDFELRVVNADGEDVPVGEPGELLFRSPTFMHGYWNQPELTAKTLLGGWLHSGDVGRVDAQGNVYILDRVKDMIVANGFNVFPKEVENAIAAHPAVLTVAVVGVPDELRGEDIFAFVVRRPGASASSEDIADHCTRHLARYKLPRYMSLVDELPLTATGKIRRFKLREIASAEIASGHAFRVYANKTAASDRSAG